MSKTRADRSRPGTEHGLALFISLVFLVLLTLLGLTAMTTDSLEGAMANNDQDMNLAFQAAETALRAGENYAGSQLTPGSGFNSACHGGLCYPSTTATPDWQSGGAAQWGIVGSGTVIPVTPPSYPLVPGVSIPPEFIVELLPNVPPPGGPLGVSTNYQSPGATTYRITAVGWGAKQSTSVMLQSIFVKP
ncbi:MAG: pilus assembly PilX family protein [Acidiferrobacteraceae bacterium]